MVGCCMCICKNAKCPAAPQDSSMWRCRFIRLKSPWNGLKGRRGSVEMGQNWVIVMPQILRGNSSEFTCLSVNILTTYKHTCLIKYVRHVRGAAGCERITRLKLLYPSDFLIGTELFPRVVGGDYDHQKWFSDDGYKIGWTFPGMHAGCDRMCQWRV